MPTIFFDSITRYEKIRFDLFGSSSTARYVRIKEITNFSSLTPQHPDYDFRVPAYRENQQYGANPHDPVAFTVHEKQKLRNAARLAMHIVADGYKAMCNYLRFINDPDNDDVIFFEKRVKAWFGCDDSNFIAALTAKMRLMQDTLQDLETFITFVNEQNQRRITCTAEVTMIDTPNTPAYNHYIDFKNFEITSLSSGDSAATVYTIVIPTIISGMRIYINPVIFKNSFNFIVQTLIHELSHKILGTVDESSMGKIYYNDSKVFADNFPLEAVTIADNWGYFYMSFGCYPGQVEYAYQDEYQITASDKGQKKARTLHTFATSKKYKTFNDLEAEEEIAAGNEPKRAKELRALKAHISRREYLDSLTAGASLMCIKKKEKKKGYLERKELFELKERMEYKELLTNIEPKTSKELKKLKKQAEHLAYMEAMDSREGRQRRQRMARLARMERR